MDDFLENGRYSFFGQEEEKEGYINYMYLQNENPVTALYNIIRGNILNRNANISPNDITILGYTTNLLRFFDLFYRYSSRERTNTMLETVEIMYLTHLNYIGKDDKEYERSTSFNESFDELLYTGLTRCKRNLVIINFGNSEYDKKMRPLIEKVK